MTTPTPSLPALRRECEQRGVAVRAGAVVTSTRGTERITHALIADFDGVNVAAGEAVSCDVLLVSARLESGGAPV
jgi:sarcosine oxidase, subunit alpha